MAADSCDEVTHPMTDEPTESTSREYAASVTGSGLSLRNRDHVHRRDDRDHVAATGGPAAWTPGGGGCHCVESRGWCWRLCGMWFKFPPRTDHRPRAPVTGLPENQRRVRASPASTPTRDRAAYRLRGIVLVDSVSVRQGEHEEVVAYARAQLRRQVDEARRARTHRDELLSVDGIGDRKASDR